MHVTDSTLAVVGIVLAVVATPLAAGTAVPAASGLPAASESAESVVKPADSPVAQDNDSRVEIEQFSVDSMTLRNVTATDVVVRELTVRELGDRRNVTLRNVSLARVEVREAELSAVRISDAVVRDEALITDLGLHYAQGSNVTNESRQSLLLEDRTFDGVVLQNVTVESVSESNASTLTTEAGDASVDASTAQIVVGNASVGAVTSLAVSPGNETTTP